VLAVFTTVVFVAIVLLFPGLLFGIGRFFEKAFTFGKDFTTVSQINFTI
jgi:hypothetical protein